jgi:hypothetical protein
MKFLAKVIYFMVLTLLCQSATASPEHSEYLAYRYGMEAALKSKCYGQKECIDFYDRNMERCLKKKHVESVMRSAAEKSYESVKEIAVTVHACINK